MSVPVTHYVNVSATLSSGSAPQAGFGTALFLNDHSSVDSDVLLGPYTSAAEVLDDGHLSGSPIHDFAVAVAQQSPRVSEFYSGLFTGDVSNALDAIEAVNPAAFYGIAMDSRADDDIIELADWTEARMKIAMVQSNDASVAAGTGLAFQAVFGGTPTDGTYRLIFTGFGLGAPVNVDVVRAGGSPATNALLGDAMRTALTTAASGTLSGEIVTSSIGGTGATVTFRMADGLLGTVTVTDPESPDGLVVTTTDNDIATRLFLGQYTRTALWYYETDADMLAERILARGLGYNLDLRQGQWSWRQLFGLSGSPLSGSIATAIRAANANYYAAAQTSGGADTTAFTFPGRFPVGASALGRRIATTVTLDWAKVRLEEAILNVLLKSTHGVPFDDNGIGQIAAAVLGVFNKGVNAKHFATKVVPAGEEFAGESTPFAKWPKAKDIDAATRASGVLTADAAVAYILGSIERVVFNLEARE